MAWTSYIGAFGSSSGAQISCSGACSSSSTACISSSGQRLQSLEAPGALFFSRGLAFSPGGATTLPHINYAWKHINLGNFAVLQFLFVSNSLVCFKISTDRLSLKSFGNFGFSQKIWEIREGFHNFFATSETEGLPAYCSIKSSWWLSTKPGNQVLLQHYSSHSVIAFILYSLCFILYALCFILYALYFMLYTLYFML